MKFIKNFVFKNRLHTISIGIKYGEFGGTCATDTHPENKRLKIADRFPL